MARNLNAAGVAFARACISAGRVSDASWSFSAADGNALLGSGGDDWANYGKHHLAVNTDASEGTKERYSYPFAKGNTLYVSALRAIRSRASQQSDTAIFDAAGRLMDALDKGKGGKGDDSSSKATGSFYSPFEFKFVEDGSAEPGSFTGYGSVFNAVDWHGDLIEPGAFAETMTKHRIAGSMPAMFVEHSGFIPFGDPLPVGVWKAIEEDAHGLKVAGRISALDSDHSKRIVGLMRDGALPGLSIAYSVPEGGATYPKSADGPRRILHRVELHSIDIVRDPSNAQARIAQIKSQVDELKALMRNVDHQGALDATKAAIRLHRSTMTGGDAPTADERRQLGDHLQTIHTCLTGSAMKGRPDTIRAFEGLLRDAGFTVREARLIAEGGFKSACQPRDEDDAAAAALAAEALKSIGLDSFTLPKFGTGD